VKILAGVAQDDLNDVAESAQRAERDGYDVLNTLENRHEPFLPLAVAAVATKRVELGTSVAIAFARSPMVVANAAWDLQNASRGRFVLGLGPQIRPHNERRFSVPWSAPVPRLREYVQALRAIWRTWELGEKLDFRGDHYQFTLMIPNFAPEPTGLASVPVTLAAIGPLSLRLSGEVADGARIHAFCTRAYLEDVCLPRIAEGLSKSGRSRVNFEISGGGFVATGSTDAEVARCVEWVRYRIAFYASTPAYWPVLDSHDLRDLGEKLNVMTKAAKWDAIAAEVSDDVVRLFSAVGRFDELAAVVGARYGGVVDATAASSNPALHSTVPPDLVQDLRALGSPFTGWRSDW
jgi:probable F420-dependent oxidoreductase